MGVDYNGVGGIGVKLEDEMIEKLIASGLFSGEEWEEDEQECVEKIRIGYSEAGNCYSGNTWFYLLVEGETLPEINANKLEFIGRLSDIGITIADEDLKVISDLHIW